MTTKFHGLRRKAYVVVAAIISVTTGFSALLPHFVAAGQATTRIVQLSDSTPSATGVTYNISFKPTATGTVGGIVIDFCSDSPIVGNTTCAFPAGFSLGTTPTYAITSGIGVGGTWTAANSLQGGGPDSAHKQVFILTNTTAQSVTAGTAVNFTITNVVNPSTTGSFFARILTFDTSANTISQYTAAGTARAASASLTNMLDYGGAAMSTTTQISITAKVQESLTFCTSAADLSGASNNTCAFATAPAVTLGHGGPPAVLDATAVDRGTIYTQMSTNASSGAIVRMKATNACANGGLSSTGGAVCNIGGTGATAAAITAGTAAFGLFVANSATTTGVTSSTGTITPDARYHNAAHVNEITPDLWYGMDVTTANDNVTTLYGGAIMSSAGPVSQINNHLVFAATASLTTQAGIYTGNEILIATGTF